MWNTSILLDTKLHLFKLVLLYGALSRDLHAYQRPGDNALHAYQGPGDNAQCLLAGGCLANVEIYGCKMHIPASEMTEARRLRLFGYSNRAKLTRTMPRPYDCWPSEWRRPVRCPRSNGQEWWKWTCANSVLGCT